MDNTTLGVIAAVVVITVSVIFLKMGGGSSSPSTGPKSSDNKNSSSNSKNDSGSSKSEKKFPAGPMNIFFGSQTGTAEGFARTLMEEAKQRGFDAHIIDLEDFESETLAEVTNAVFLMATYGEGEPTDNSAKFIAWLRDESHTIEKGYLSKTCFTVFGLGNRQYEHYNKMGKETNELLERHGARRSCPYGEGDDDGTLEEDFDKWRETMWPIMVSAFHPDSAGMVDDEGNDTIDENFTDGSTKHRARTSSKVELDFRTVVVSPNAVNELLESRQYDVHTSDSTKSSSSARANDAAKLLVNSSTKFYFTAAECAVVDSRELRTPEDGGSTGHIEVDITGSGLSYHTADNLAVLPENSDDVVLPLCSALGYDANEYFILESTADEGSKEALKFKHMFPTPCTIGDALRKYCDIQCIPRHSAVCGLLPYVQDSEQRAWLENLTEKSNRPLFKTIIEEGCKSIFDLLKNGGNLDSCKIPLADFLNLVPRLQPRYYTISSSSSVYPNHIHITVALTEKKIPDGRKFVGVCSSDLLHRVTPETVGSPKKSKKSKVRSKIRVFVRASTFRLPQDLSTPILMIGPGTGIAPMRALLQERKFRMDQVIAQKAKAPTMENILYFGCKNRAMDYIYSNELEEYEKNGTLSALHCAFSREQAHKVYVQHLIQRPEDAKRISDLLLARNGFLFVCGATAMGNDVHDALLNILQISKGMTASAAASFLKDLQHAGRYVQELWSD